MDLQCIQLDKSIQEYDLQHRKLRFVHKFQDKDLCIYFSDKSCRVDILNLRCILVDKLRMDCQCILVDTRSRHFCKLHLVHMVMGYMGRWQLA